MQIKEVFQQALQELEESAAGPSNQGWAQVQADGQDRSTSAGCSELSAILDLHAAVGRDHQAHQVSKPVALPHLPQYRMNCAFWEIAVTWVIV